MRPLVTSAGRWSIFADRRCVRMVDPLRSCDGLPYENVSIHPVRSSRTVGPLVRAERSAEGVWPVSSKECLHGTESWKL